MVERVIQAARVPHQPLQLPSSVTSASDGASLSSFLPSIKQDYQ